MKYERFLVGANIAIAVSQAVQVFLNYRASRRSEERIQEAHDMNMRYLNWQMRPYGDRLKDSLGGLNESEQVQEQSHGV